MKQRQKLLRLQRFTLLNKFKNNKSRENIYGYAFLLPSLLGVLIFVLIPFIDVCRRSFYNAMGNSFVGFDNYLNVFNNEAFIMAVKNTLRFLAVCLPVLLISSLAAALIINSLKVHREFYKSVLLVPMAVPVASIVVLWKAFFLENGIINNVLSLAGFERIDYMNSKYAFGVLIFTYVWKNLGYDMILWLASLYSIPLSLYEAAKIDGADNKQCFRYITIPNLKGSFVIIFILSFVNSFKVFREAYLISGAYPDDSIYMLQHVFNNWFMHLDIQKMTAGAVLMAAFFIGIVLVFFRNIFID